MRPAEHANLLSIFFWIFAGVQTLIFLLILLVVVLMGGMSVFAIFEGSKGSTEASVMFGVIAFIYGFILLFGAVSIFLNIKAGKLLRSGMPVSTGNIKAAAIVDLASFLCGGILMLPFGVAIGVYGLWFATSLEGKAYLANPLAFNTLPPPPIQNFQPAEVDRERTPYGWS